jgi:hypothetical protein
MPHEWDPEPDAEQPGRQKGGCGLKVHPGESQRHPDSGPDQRWDEDRRTDQNNTEYASGQSNPLAA